MIHVFTCSAPNYVGKARVLFESLRRHAPRLVVHWLVADRRQPELAALVGDEVDHVSFLEDLDLDLEDGEGWWFLHDVVELSTAIKPFMARRLLAREDCDLVVYLDPDVALFSAVDDLLSAAENASVLLTPHLLRPESAPKPIFDNELCCLRNGVFNLGFVAVRDCDEGHAFLAWWAERCRLLCTAEPGTGAFTDQKWIDLAPIFFPGISIVRDARFNVAAWNVGQRRVTGTFDEGFRVDGRSLGFYHFTGLDSGAHQQVIDFYAAGDRAVHMLVQWYGHRSRFLTPARGLDWSLGRYDDGWEILPHHRRLYRERADLRAAFPDPYRGRDEASFTTWLIENGTFGASRRAGPGSSA